MGKGEYIQGISLTPGLKEVLKNIIDDGGNNDAEGDASINLRQIIDEADTSLPEHQVITLKAIKLAKSIITGLDDSMSQLKKLDQSLCNAKLVFNSDESTTSPEAEANKSSYANRITKLKLKEQERNYSKLTANLDHSVADDTNMKSMTYAASVGANMIVAPISIGVLMYFFAGKLFAFVVPSYRVEPGKIDIAGVIAGVITGVVMLFIEMILFVIRSHEMDKFVTKKMKKEVNPFGYDKKAAQRTFEG
jgi:hypothetical protein